MNLSSITFNLEEFNKLFPFYLMVDKDMEILSWGSSMSKMTQIEKGMSFNDLFFIRRPELEKPSYTDILANTQQMVILEYNKDESIVMRGQFVAFFQDQNILFIGSPWFGSMDQVRGKKLTIDDFAIHDSMVDLLHVLKTQEIATEDIKELLITVNQQKNKLKKDQKELRRLSLVASANENGVLFADSDGLITWVNEGFRKISGYAQEELLGKAFADLLEGSMNDKQLLAKVSADLKSTNNFDYEFPQYKKDGSFFWARIKKHYLQNNVGDNLHAFVTVEDVSAQKKQQAQLRVLSLIAEDNINAVIIADAEGRIEWINSSFTRMTGYELHEIEGKKPGEVLQGPETDPKTVAYLSKQVREGKPFNCEILNYSRSGEKYWLRVSGQAILNSAGEVNGFFALEEDITNEKKGRERLRESENRLFTLISNLHSGILLADENKNIVFANNQFCRMFETSIDPKSLKGTQCQSLADQSKKLFKDSVAYLETNQLLMERKKPVTAQELELVDGKVFSFDFIPIYVEQEYKGHLWNFVDITERKNYEKTRQIQEAKYRNIIANMNLGLLEVDQDDIIEHANHSFCDISGFSIEQLKGKKASDIFLEGKSKKIIEGKNTQREAGISDFYQMQIRNAKGEMRWWLISRAPNFNDKGEKIGSIGIHLDITEQKRLEQELELARQKAEEASKAKESFLANMSHEIRTPLNAIVGMVRELSKEQMTQKQSNYLHNAETASQHLLSIINNILDISKIEAGVFVLEPQPFDMRVLINETISIMYGNASGKLLNLEAVISDNVASVLIGDQTRIRQILINIIGNAIKFTEKGKVSVHCRGEETKDSAQLIVLEVQDTGIGMEKSFQQNLFKKFTQEDLSTARKYGGSGLGMSLTYELVRLMAGTIDVFSEKGNGTRVDIRLLLPTGNESMLKSDWQKDDFSLLESIKVLLVEDNELNRLVASNTLALYNMQITEATNGQEAIERIKKEDFDIVLMDLQMPVMDGITATKIIRTKLHKELPIIALTANAFKQEIAVCLSSGMNDYVIKPFEEHELYRVMAANLKDIPLEHRLDSKNAPAEQVVKSTQLYNLGKLHEMSRGNDDFVRKMIRLFLSTTPSALDQILQAHSQGDFQTVGKTAHRIKPSIDNMGILCIKDEIREIEKLAVENPESPQLVKSITKVKEVLIHVVALLEKEKILVKEN